MLSIAGVTSRKSIPDRSPGHAFVRIARAGRPGYENLGRCAVEVFAVTGAGHTPPLDSRFRENDELGGRTCFRTHKTGALKPEQLLAQLAHCYP